MRLQCNCFFKALHFSLIQSVSQCAQWGYLPKKIKRGGKIQTAVDITEGCHSLRWCHCFHQHWHVVDWSLIKWFELEELLNAKRSIKPRTLPLAIHLQYGYPTLSKGPAAYAAQTQWDLQKWKKVHENHFHSVLWHFRPCQSLWHLCTSLSFLCRLDSSQ